MADVTDLEPFRKLASGNISDAMEMMGFRRSVILGLTMVAKPNAVMVGRALTVRQLPKHVTAKADEGLVRHAEVSTSIAKKGQVVVIDCGGDVASASWGEIHSVKCVLRGVAGAVIDGATRDAQLIRETGFPMFCAAFTPVKSRWDLETAAIGEPVGIRGVQVRPDDIVFGDESGVIVVPKEHAAEILAKATEICEAEEKIVADLRKKG
ncbi:MAG: hypothetical protein WD270_08485 [Acetobacterales bacterium]